MVTHALDAIADADSSAVTGRLPPGIKTSPLGVYHHPKQLQRSSLLGACDDVSIDK